MNNSTEKEKKDGKAFKKSVIATRLRKSIGKDKEPVQEKEVKTQEVLKAGA